MADNKNNKSRNNQDADNEKLLNYLKDNLNDKERNQLEHSFENDPFANDAIEGLEQISSVNLPTIIDEINVNLRKEIKKQKRKKRNTAFSNQSWIYFAVALILLLLIITYFLFKRMNG